MLRCFVDTVGIRFPKEGIGTVPTSLNLYFAVIPDTEKVFTRNTVNSEKSVEAW